MTSTDATAETGQQSARTSATRLGRAPTDSLLRNGLALVSSAALSSVLGFAFWVLSARMFSSETVGVNSVLISTMLTLANLSQLNLGNYLTRTLAGAGQHAGRIVLRSYLVAVVSAGLFAIAFIVTVPILTPELAGTLANPWIAAGYVASIIAWTIFSLQDNVLTGLRQAIWVPTENGIFSLAKIGLLFVLAGTALDAAGPFLAWMLPAVLLIPLINGLIALRALPVIARQPAIIDMPGFRQLASMMGWDYLGTVASMIALGAAPLMVLDISGASAAAGYSVAWSMTYSVYLVSRSMGMSMIAEAAAFPERRRALASRTIVVSMSLLGLATIGLIIFAPYILLVFGSTYAAENSLLLRLLMLSSIPWGLTTIYVSVARSTGKTHRIAIIQLATLVVLIGLGYLLLPRMGVVGMGVAWLAAHTLTLAGILVRELIAGPRRIIELLLLIGSSAARYAGSLLGMRRKTKTGLDESEQAKLADMLGRPLGSLRINRIATADNDCATYRVKLENPDEPDAPTFFVKRAAGASGLKALDHHMETVSRLNNDIAASGMANLLPEIVGFSRIGEGGLLVQRGLPGQDGRIFLRHQPDMSTALALASGIMDEIHQTNRRSALADSDWLRQWVDEPLDLIAQTRPVIFGGEARRGTIEALRSVHHAWWTRGELALGWNHGDFSPGNIFFAQETGGPVTLAGILDWDGARSDGPRGLDAWHLALTAESLRRDEELGLVVGDMIGLPRQTPSDENAAGMDSLAGRMLVELAWLQHVGSNLRKSPRYGRNRVWCLCNIDWVLARLPEAKKRVRGRR